jgi:predicted enzyme related to lactoylglutathione lyase
MKNPVTWFEIIGKDGSTLHKFYSEVFGWKLTPPVADMGNYSMLSEHGPGQHGAGGGIGAGMQGESRVSVYVEVDDPQRYLDRATKAGATVLMPVTTITPDTTIAMFRDPAGNVNGILKANPRAGAAATTARKKTTARRKTTARKSTARKSTARKKTTTRRRRR